MTVDPGDRVPAQSEPRPLSTELTIMRRTIFIPTFLALATGSAWAANLCVAAPSSEFLDPPAPYYTPCTPVASYPAELAESPYGDGCLNITTSSVGTDQLNWGALKGRFE